MEIRPKFIVKLTAIACLIIAMLAMVHRLMQNEAFEIREWAVLFTLPFLICLGFFLIPTLRITFSEKGVSSYWKIAIGRIIIWEDSDYHLRWKEVNAVFSQFPVWIPFHLIGLTGYQGNKMRMLYIGAFMTKKKESLIYIVEHVGSGVVEKHVLRLAEQYRQQLQKRLTL